VQTWVPNWDELWNPPSWSLSVEALFYVLFPLLGVWLCRLTRRWQLAGCVVAWLACMVFPLLGAPLLSQLPGPLGYLAVRSPIWHLPEFLFGVLVARLWMMTTVSPPARGLVPAVLLCAVLLAVVTPDSWYATLHNGLLDPLFAVLIVCLAQGRGALARLLALPALVTLGEASYGLYLLHSAVWTWLIHAVPPPWGSPAMSLYIVCYAGVAVSASLLSLRLLEQPARRAIRRRWAHG
jgi:peptidoglycan/LPS O-acetylase OafA/YrhL